MLGLDEVYKFYIDKEGLFSQMYTVVDTFSEKK